MGSFVRILCWFQETLPICKDFARSFFQTNPLTHYNKHFLKHFYHSNTGVCLKSGSGAKVLSSQPLKLFKEYKCENGVWPNAKIVRCEAFP